MARFMLPTMGSLVMWSLSETKITPADLRALCAREGDDELASSVPDIDPPTAIKRAAREWRPTRSGDAGRYRTEVTDAGAGAVTVGLLRRRHVRTGEVEWVQVSTCTYDVGADQWSIDDVADTLAGDLAGAFVETARDAVRFLDHAFIRPSIVQRRLNDMASAKARDRGAIYIPPGHDEALDRLARIVAGIGQSSLDIYDIAASPRSAAAATGAVRASLTEKLAECREQIAEWRGKARKPRADALENMVGEFQDLKDRAVLYADALRITLTDIDADIEAARADVMALLNGGAA